MPMPIELLQELKSGLDFLQKGRLIEAQSSGIRADTMLINLWKVLTPYEMLLNSAAIALLFKKCGNFQLAAMRFEKVCILAEQLEPNSSQTYGDFYDLAECYLKIGNKQEAIKTLQRSRPICARACPVYLSNLDQKIQALLGMNTHPDPISIPVNVEIQCSAINYSLVHSGISIFESLWVQNKTDYPIEDITIQITIPGYTLPNDPTYVRLAAAERQDISSLVKMNFVQERLEAQLERAKASIEVSVNSQPQKHFTTWLLAYNECSWQSGHEIALATFVHPNNAAVKVIAKQALTPFIQNTGCVSFFDAHISHSGKYTEEIARSIFHCLSEQYNLVYDYEPPSWEANSQRVRFPDEVVVNGIGTCLDFMLLFTAIFENILLASHTKPVMIITRGKTQHALVGCWRVNPLSRETVIVDQKQVAGWVESGALFVMETTGFAEGNPFWKKRVRFEDCVEKGKELIAKANRLTSINMSTVRPNDENFWQGVTPLPFRTEPQYSESALRALWHARQRWQESPTEYIQSTHLLRGLLQLDTGEAKKFFNLLADQTNNTLLHPTKLDSFIAAGLQQVARPISIGPIESENYTAIIQTARTEARRLNAFMVEDLHLLFALLRQPGNSVTKVLSICGSSAAECLAFLEQIHQVAQSEKHSQFPSEVQQE